MPELTFRVTGARPVPRAMMPIIALDLAVSQTGTAGSVPLHIHHAMLQCQVRIEPARRQYRPEDEAGLWELFGERQRWHETMHSMLWTQVPLVIRAFDSETTAELLIPCTHDFNVAATKYFDQINDGEVPFTLLFRGSIFYAEGQLPLRVQQIAHDQHADFRLPAQIWRDLMDYYYPNSSWIPLKRSLHEALRKYQKLHGFLTYDEALAALLNAHSVAPPAEQAIS